MDERSRDSHPEFAELGAATDRLSRRPGASALKGSGTPVWGGQAAIDSGRWPSASMRTYLVARKRGLHNAELSVALRSAPHEASANADTAASVTIIRPKTVEALPAMRVRPSQRLVSCRLTAAVRRLGLSTCSGATSVSTGPMSAPANRSAPAPGSVTCPVSDFRLTSC